MLYLFVKFFSDLEYAESMLDGHIYMNTLSYFAQMESDNDLNRPDRAEGVAAIFQPQNTIIEIDGIKIDSNDITRPIEYRRVTGGSYEGGDLSTCEGNVFCLSTIHNSDFEPSVESTNDEEYLAALSEMKNHMLFSDEVYDFGDYAILINDGEEFVRRMRDGFRTTSAGHSIHNGLVRYYDDSFSGSFQEHEIGFHKPDWYAFQREYRFLIRPSRQGPFTLEIGDIRDISELMTSDQLRSHLDSLEIVPTTP